LAFGEFGMNTTDANLFVRQTLVSGTQKISKVDRRDNQAGDVVLFGKNVSSGANWIPANGNSFATGVYPQLDPLFGTS
ncbi:hypothetical protein BB65665_14513, partial [Bacillus sp. 916]|uniref:hypothetical protein n=1 Tax=Bacillus sp. 916 TaxID=1007654 RepID=UPI00026BA446